MDVLKLYAAYNMLLDLGQWCPVSMANFLDRPVALACFNFTLGMIYKQSDPDKTKMYFTQAKLQRLKSSDIKQHIFTPMHQQ